MNLVEKIFKEKGEEREKAFLLVAYSIATGKTKKIRLNMFDDLVDYIEEPTNFKNIKLGNIFCTCGNSLDSESNEEYCEDCRDLQF